MRYWAQIWRFFTPIFLHAGFMHIFVICHILTHSVKHAVTDDHWVHAWKRDGTLQSCHAIHGIRVRLRIMDYFSIGGNLFTALCSPDKISVGASTSIFGLLACLVSKFTKSL
jgi:hypothetical protein